MMARPSGASVESLQRGVLVRPRKGTRAQKGAPGAFAARGAAFARHRSQRAAAAARRSLHVGAKRPISPTAQVALQLAAHALQHCIHLTVSPFHSLRRP